MIPEKFIDPIMNNVLITPVILPSSKMIVELSNIERYLRTSQTDPFTKIALTNDELRKFNEETETKKTISKLKDEMKEFIDEFVKQNKEKNKL